MIVTSDTIEKQNQKREKKKFRSIQGPFCFVSNWGLPNTKKYL